MAAPFDPTTNDRKEWERLAASKWLPPILQKVGGKSNLLQLQKKVSRKILVLDAVGSQSFPNQEIRASHQTKKKLMSNVCTRFVKKLKMRALYLEELAVFLEAKEKQDAESMERKWTLAKQLSKSARFLNYIHFLEDRAKTLEDREISSAEQVKPLDLIKDVPQMETVDVKNSISGLKALDHKSFYDLRDEIASSPFKPKEKSLKRVIVGIDEELDYDFSKPPNTSEDVNVEFGRAFRDIYQIGTTAKEKWSKVLADKKAFGVRRSNESVELLCKKEVTKSNLDSKKQIMNTNYETKQNPALKNSSRFNTLREEEHTKLLTLLENRKKDRFNRSKNLKTIQPVFKLIDSDMTRHTSRRQSSIWKDTLPHLWVEDPYNHHIKNKPGQKQDREIVKKNLEKTKAAIPEASLPSAADFRAKLGWAKIKSLARVNSIINMPIGPRNSIANPNCSDTIRSEILNLITK